MRLRLTRPLVSWSLPVVAHVFQARVTWAQPAGPGTPTVPAEYYEQPDPLGVWLPVAGLVLIVLAIWLPMRRTQRMDAYAEERIEAERAAAAESLARP